MSLTNRKPQFLKRPIPKLRDASLIVIACEGEITEKEYFESECFQSSRLRLKILETTDGKSAPNHVAKRLREFVHEIDLHSGDQLWLVMDKDRWTAKNLAEVAKTAFRGKLAANIAVSNPSFELWLLLHISEINGGKHTNKMLNQLLKANLGSYAKNSIFPERFTPTVALAIQRAKDLDVNPRRMRWPNNPGTHVYRLVEQIHKLL